MTQVIEITATWRKTKKGEWVAFGKAADLQAALDNDLPVTMVRKDGTRQVRDLDSVGKAFTVNGTQMCYGYLRPEARQAPRKDMPGWAKLQAATKPRTRTGKTGTCEECGKCGPVVQAFDMSGISGHVCTRCKAAGSLSFA